MFQRFFGAEKKTEPAPSLDDVSGRAQGRVTELDEKIAKTDLELGKYRDQLKKLKPGPTRKQVEGRAMQVLKQKRMYEKQRDQVSGQVFNIDQAKFAQASIKDSIDMAQAMRATTVAMKSQMGEFDIGAIEDMHDDMEDLMLDTDEINEILGRSYGVPENIDEEDLAAELNALDDELASEAVEEEPEYLKAPAPREAIAAASASASQRVLVAAAISSVTNSSSGSSGARGGGGGGGLLISDLPSAPSNQRSLLPSAPQLQPVQQVRIGQ